jgi:hypothetical protein
MRDLPMPERTIRMGRNPGRSKPPQVRGCDRGTRKPGASSARNGLTSPGGEEPGIRATKPIVFGPGPWRYDWRMKDELAFLQRIGHWRALENVANRAQLLRGYLEGLRLRRRWINLQREPLEYEAKLLLQALEDEPGSHGPGAAA